MHSPFVCHRIVIPTIAYIGLHLVSPTISLILDNSVYYVVRIHSLISYRGNILLTLYIKDHVYIHKGYVVSLIRDKRGFSVQHGRSHTDWLSPISSRCRRKIGQMRLWSLPLHSFTKGFTLYQEHFFFKPLIIFVSWDQNEKLRTSSLLHNCTLQESEDLKCGNCLYVSIFGETDVSAVK